MDDCFLADLDHKFESLDEISDRIQVVDRTIGELPPGAITDSDNENTKDERDPHAALDIALDIPFNIEQNSSTPESNSFNISGSKSNRSYSEVKQAFSLFIHYYN